MTTLSTPTHTTDAGIVVQQIRAIAPLLRKNAAEGEKNRRVVDESIQALDAAGAFRVAIPKRYGGGEASVKTMLEVSSAVGEADGGTAWVVALTNVCCWLAGLFSTQAQDDVFGKNPNAKVSGVLAPTSTARKVDGGYRIDGKWYYNSGSWHADWAILGMPIVDHDGNVVDQGFALIPKSDLELEETWFVAGMRSSGSNALIAKDVFVPEYRVMSVPPAIEGTYATEHQETEPLYRSAFVPVLSIVLAGPQLGLGRAVLEFVREKSGQRGIAYTKYVRQADSTPFQLQMAQAALMIDTAHLHAYRAAQDIDDAATQGTYMDVLERARVRADTGWAIEHVTKAIDILMSAHGAGSFAESSPLQRLWRDSAVAARHAVTMPILDYEIYGKALVGATDMPTDLV